jgi:hypothetical protein
MYSNQTFGGANRGPASMRPPSRRSNAFVDIGFVALIIACCGVVAFQYHPLLTTTGYNVAAGHIERVGFPYYYYSAYHSRSRSSGLDWFDFLRADFTYTVDGKSYHSSATSVPLITLLSWNALTLRPQAGLAVRYDPADPKKCVPVEVIDSFSKCAIASYVAVFIVGFVFLFMAGMTNLSGEKWSISGNSDVY